ncbi:single-stranded DNA-binding protein [Kitasatospora griseola]|uniref:single-stranded DNA-binding protein n=1 Tax=Kitasatospora griseola TaxID=2064 RepID=UPI00344AA9A5
MSVPSSTPARSDQVHPAQQPRDMTNDLLVLRLRVAERSGVVSTLTMSVPSPTFDTIGLQLAHLVAYLGVLHAEGQGPTGAGVHTFLSSRTAWSWYPWQPLHDARVTCQLDVMLGPVDESGWPAVSLVALESEDGTWGFSRKRRRMGAGAVAAVALEEIHRVHVNLCAKAAQDKEADTARRRDEADALLAEVRKVDQEARALANSAGVRKARAALHQTPEPEPGVSTFAELDPEPDRVETFTGRITEIESRTNDAGETALLFTIAHEQRGRAGAGGFEVPEKLRCTLRGESAQAAAGLAVGRRVIAVGRLVQQVYVSKGQAIPRSLITFDIRSLGVDLLTSGLA